jgi:hypothetical protein
MTITTKELSARLNGRERRKEMTKEEEAEARAAGLVVVFCASDDLMEFRGAIDDETDCYEGGTAYLTNAGLVHNECEDECCHYYLEQCDKAQTIKAVWGDSGCSWTFQTGIPHHTFDIMEDGDTYCRGIVFALAEQMIADRAAISSVETL